MDEELDNLFADVFKDQEQPTDQPADDDGKQEQKETGAPEEQKEEPAAEEAAERSRNAQRRQRREARIADEARKAERERLNQLLKGVGIERDDGSTIDDVEALEAFYKSQSDERIAQGRANAEDIRRIAQEAVRPEKDSADVDKELEMIREMDPAMMDLEPREVLSAILNSDIGASFRKHVESGATFIQAYGRATRERNALAAGARNADAAKAAGKGHLGRTTQRGEGALSVPSEVKSIWKALNPDDSEEEIQKYYNKDRKRFG